MKNEFVDYKTALALKELGFNEECFAVYSEHDETRVYNQSDIREGLTIPAPLYQQAFRWFREKYGLFSEIQPYLIIGTQWRYTITNRNNSSGLPHKEGFQTYEEAEQACLEKLIEIIKKDAHI